MLVPEPGQHHQESPLLPLPGREELAGVPVEMIQRGGLHNAEIYIVDLGHGPLVVKDYAAKPRWRQLMGWAQILHERNAYRRLGPLPFLPRFLGRIDANALAMERVVAVPLGDDHRRFQARRDYLHKIRLVCDHFISRGFVHLDLRGRSNVLIRPDGELVVVDMEGSLWFRPGSLLHRLFRRAILMHYKSVLHKWRRVLSKDRDKRHEKSFLGRFLYRLRRPHSWFPRT